MTNENNEQMRKCPHCQTEIPQKAKKCPHCQSDLRNWFCRHPLLTILMLLMSIIIFPLLISPILPQDGNISQTPSNQMESLNGRISKDNVSIRIYNDDETEWQNCKIRLNSDYRAFYNLGSGKNEITYAEFTKNDGTRFNYYTVNPKEVYISCEKPYGDLFGKW